MAKDGTDREEGLRRKLAKAQAQLQEAQEVRARAVTKGEQQVERARQKAAARVARATRTVEKRAAKAAKLEERLAHHGRQRAGHGNGHREPHSTPKPQEKEDKLEMLAVGLIDGAPQEQVVVPNGPTPVAPPAGAQISKQERQVLVVLQERFADNGATFTEWLTATELPKRTFVRARKSAVERGLVARDGDTSGARYFLTETGKAFVGSY